jgi:DNA polymerase I-like protein with 3'-5' exonuclease and polymerase domains
VDVHKLTAARALGITEDAVSDEQRQNGKTTNFALLYGARPEVLVEQAA